MRKSIFIVAAMLMLLACGGKKAQAVSKDTSATESTAEEAKEKITGLIKELYAAAAQNASDIDQRFACHTWREAVKAVEEKDSKLEEIGFFNDDYWTEMQDSNPSDLEARDIKFEQLDVEKGTALVDFILHSSVQNVHMKFNFCREDGDWRVHDITRINKDSDGKDTSFSFLESMHSYLNEENEDMTELTFSNMAGIYDSLDDKMNSESRFCLKEDGTATWNMIGSLHLTEYTYTIKGNTICLKAKGVDSEEDCYVYDSDTRSLKNEQGAVYYRQIEE